MGVPAPEAAGRWQERLRRAWDEGGPAAVARRGWRAVRARAFATTSSDWFCRRLGGVERAAGVRDRGDAVRITVADHPTEVLEWLRAQHARFPWVYLPAELAVAGREGHVVASLFDGEELVGCLRVGMRRVYVADFESTVRLPEGDAFVYDTFVLPACRGRGLAYRAIVAAMAHLGERGYRRLWCHIEPWNTPSLRVYERAGFGRVARIRHMRIAGARFFIRDGVVPMLGLDGFLRRQGPPAPGRSAAAR